MTVVTKEIMRRAKGLIRSKGWARGRKRPRPSGARKALRLQPESPRTEFQ